MNAARRLIAVAALCAGIAPAQAALYRCPAAQGDEAVVTNLMREADATERGCEPVQARRSTLDAPPRAEPARAAAVAARFGDEWVRGKPAVRDTAPRGAVEHVVPKDVQRARDNDARAILAAELGREEQKLAELTQRAQALAPNSGERAQLSAAVTRHSADAESIRREIARLR